MVTPIPENVARAVDQALAAEEPRQCPICGRWHLAASCVRCAFDAWQARLDEVAS